jgi:hypothetical protein
VQTLTNIEDQFSSKDLFDAFKIQLARDFEQGNFPADFVVALEPDYFSILKKIATELQRNEKRTDSGLMPLLYRIDISEAQLEKYLREHQNENHLEVIAGLIIKRVLQKVVIKKYYKKNENM